MRIKGFSIMLLMLSATLARGEASGLTPLGKDLVDGKRLVLHAASCSFELPGPDWKWMGYDGNKSANYVCLNPRTNAFFGVAVGKNHIPLSDHQPQSLLENAKKAIAKRGGKIENDKYEFVEIPDVKKCVRVAFQEIESSGAKSLVIIYLINTVDDVSVKLQCAGPNAAEPDALKTLFKSLQILK